MDDEIIYSWCFHDVECFDSTPSAAIIILDKDLESFSSLRSQQYIQEEMSKILQKISSTSLATSSEHYAFTSYSNITPVTNTSILDSGATYHMSPQKSMFKSYEPVNTNHRVFTANGRVLTEKELSTLITL